MTPNTARSALISIAARMVRMEPLGFLSPFADDMPKRTPKWVLSAIAEAEERLRNLAVEVRKIADGLEIK